MEEILSYIEWLEVKFGSKFMEAYQEIHADDFIAMERAFYKMYHNYVSNFGLSKE